MDTRKCSCLLTVCFSRSVTIIMHETSPTPLELCVIKVYVHTLHHSTIYVHKLHTTQIDCIFCMRVLCNTYRWCQSILRTILTELSCGLGCTFQFLAFSDFICVLLQYTRMEKRSYGVNKCNEYFSLNIVHKSSLVGV